MSREVISVSGLWSMASSPRPSAFFLDVISYINCFICFAKVCHSVLLKYFPRQVEVIDRTYAGGVMHYHGFTKAGGLAKPCIAVDDRIENHLLEMRFDFFDHLL